MLLSSDAGKAWFPNISLYTCAVYLYWKFSVIVLSLVGKS